MVESGIGEGKGGVEGWAGVGLFCRFVYFSSFSSFFSRLMQRVSGAERGI